jgi:hypothetical protein
MVVIDDTVQPPVIVFDSDEKLFHATEIRQGSITLPARQAVTPGGSNRQVVNLDAYHLLSSINPSADIVLGSFSVTTFGGSQGISGLGVFNAGGTYVHLEMGAPGINNPAQIVNSDVTSFAAYTFIASGGGLYLNERVYLDAGTNPNGLTLTRPLLSIRFDYKLFVGTLT